jgi:peroxiredoxin
MKRVALSIIILFCIQFSLSAQGAAEGLFIGSKAPDFKAKDQSGNDVHLKELLKKGKVILVFYRGYWSPYCIKELTHLQDSLSFIQEKRATVVAVSPETIESRDSTINKSNAGFAILHDSASLILKKYSVDYTLSNDEQARYRSSGLDLNKINGTNGPILPVPAVYIIDKEFNITYRFFEQNFRKRPSVANLLENL